jgi:hypothetical protein
MRTPDTAKPATALHGEPPSNFEHLGGRLDNLITSNPADLQVFHLTAETLAPLVVTVRPYSAGPR